MPIIDSQPGLDRALTGEMTPKFLATRSPDGVPNVVPCTSIMPAGDAADRLIFGNFLLRKTVANLDGDARIGLLVITTALEGWILRARFVGWQRTGPYVDRIMNTILLRYNAYTGIRNAGIIEVEFVAAHFRLSKLRVLADYLVARAARSGARAAAQPPAADGSSVIMPPAVREPFSRMSAVRVLTFLDGKGRPLPVPVLSLQPAGERALVCAYGPAAGLLGILAPGDQVAASLLTFDVVSFQAKGRWLGSRHLLGVPVGAMSVAAVYAGGPPIPGGQVA